MTWKRFNPFSISCCIIFTWSLPSIVSAGSDSEGLQSRHEATLIPGYDIPMQIMAEILEDNNILHQSPSRSAWLPPLSQTQDIFTRQEQEAQDRTSHQTKGLSSRDLVFSILSRDARMKAMEQSNAGERVERNIQQPGDTDMRDLPIYNSATFLLNSGFEESHFERLFSQVGLMIMSPLLILVLSCQTRPC